MSDDTKGGGELFIVDNSISGWTGLRYLQEWSGIAKSFDIATGYFEIGSLLELDGKWQGLEKIRILMGDETTHRTRKMLLEAVKSRAEDRLDGSLETAKELNPFLNGVPAILAALKSGQIECRVYDKNKFHAKAYITHAKLDVVGAQALVGSSNFTKPGLTENVELNIQVQSGREVAQLQDWFNVHWAEGKDITEDVVRVISRHTQVFTPFDVYARALREFFKGHEMTAGEWEESGSKMFPALDQYQKEAYWALMKIARQHGGAFLCDGVGLGKTFVGLMLIERLILHEHKNVVLFAPKGAKEGVWEPHLKDWLSHIGGVRDGADFSNLAVFSHTDLSRGRDFPARFQRVARLADVVIIDEAHHFRNRGKTGGSENGDQRSRYYRLDDLLDPAVSRKTVFMLTATPINNRIADFRHMAELFTRRDETYFARTLGVNNLSAHFNQQEKAIKQLLGTESVDLGENLSEVQKVLAQDDIFQHLVVQRSRAYAKDSQTREKGSSVSFPTRKDPQVAEYSIRTTYKELLELVETAFAKKNPLFTLAIYYPLAYYQGPDESIDPLEEGRQKQVVGLIRTMFLKRFESSVCAFELSCDRLLRKLLAFLTVHAESDSEKKRLQRWTAQHADILNYTAQRQLSLNWDDEDEDWEDDVLPTELLQAVEKLDREDYKVDEIVDETYGDLAELVRFLLETKRFQPQNDDKLKKLKRLLNSKDLKDQKVLVFTEFADTARYLRNELVEAGVRGVAQVDSGSKANRGDIIRRFAPYYNGATTASLEAAGEAEIRVLVSTDVLSEGLNLQDACRMVNYDIHWNPVRLMQRIGRVDRRMNPQIEAQLIADHPETESSRGHVMFWNFIPPNELNAILSLYTKVTQKTLLISKKLGIEGKKLLTPKDDYEALKEFNGSYEGTKTAVEEMHLEYQALLQEHPELAAALRDQPDSVFSGRKRLAKGTTGVFFCYALPALDTESNRFTEEAGTTRWYLYETDSDRIFEEPREIVGSIRSKPETPRRCTAEAKTLLEIRKKVEKHIKNTYLKRVNAPLGVKPNRHSRMELKEV